ncbi:hypothetical protein [Maribacter arenosus]|uniref:DUF998 domain-containing protein n=1 Tax=Maribacter arenosus TaxID=1854708 RepID=A0ABR7VA13_9FLAO|nr:hypothetical protein [Maribacter arenosus]MBD0850188.1 hypothetical protein [Maribacter arenosus]
MKKQSNVRFGIFSLLMPLIGIGLFVLFYILSALNYPGGSWYSPNQEGFSFWHNYLCDLLDVYAINGDINTARVYAIIALGFLCSGLFWLWMYLPRAFITNGLNQKIMWVSGLLSILTIPFLALGEHDLIVRIAGLFGIIAFISCSIELLKAGHKFLFALGILCILIFLANYYTYETGIFIGSLPVIQKITFLLFIVWFIYLDVLLVRKVIARKRLSQDDLLDKGLHTDQ